MNKTQEALKLALEALGLGDDASLAERDQAITAIRTALASKSKEDFTIRKPWVALTDKEKSDLWCESTGRDCVNEDTHVFADAIEAKLKGKNA